MVAEAPPGRGPQDELEEDGVLLRPWRPEDADVVVREADPVPARRLGLPPPPWPTDALAGPAAVWADEWQRRERTGYSVVVEERPAAGWSCAITT